MSNLVSGWLVGLVLPGVALAQGAATAEERERLLLARIAALEARLAALEARLGNGERAVVCASPSAAPSAAVPTAAPAGAMVNYFFDGYTAWNANRPANRTNLLRGYDGVAGGFGLNQTGLVVERAASAEDGRRWGFRLDLMAGQATDTLQGSRQNESRPEVYRHVFQAYGTYIVPVGRGGDSRLRQVGERPGARRQLHEGPDQLLPELLFQLSAVLPYGVPGELSAKP
jgi:hypothetical protein